MDREKLNKAAGEYSKKLGKCRDVTWNDGEYGFIAGVDWLMQQSLSERLTDAEKEKIIKRYKDELEMAQHHTRKMKESANPTSRQFHAYVREGYISRLKLLEQIFGKDLFNDNPGLLK